MKNSTAAITHKLMEDVPLCAAAATQRGPRTVAMLNNKTSQNPMALGICWIGFDSELLLWVTPTSPMFYFHSRRLRVQTLIVFVPIALENFARVMLLL